MMNARALARNVSQMTAFLSKREDLRGNSISAWRFLMANVEHEVHHRSQLASYFTWMGAEAPQLYGIYMEELPQ